MKFFEFLKKAGHLFLPFRNCALRGKRSLLFLINIMKFFNRPQRMQEIDFVCSKI